MRKPLQRIVLGARIASGTAFMVAPRTLGGAMIGPGATEPGTRLFVQAFGARDAILGAGGLAAGARGESARPWLLASAAADAADAALGSLLFRRLPPGRRVLVLVASLAPAALNLAVALGTES